jgi:hypothetical protein
VSDTPRPPDETAPDIPDELNDADRVSLSKRDTSSAAPDGDGKPAPVRVPRTINLVVAAIAAQVVFTLVRAISMFGYTGELQRLLIKSNNDAKPADRKVPYGPAQIADDLHRVRVNGLWTAIVVSAALILLAYTLRRTGTANVSRWALIAVMLLTGGPFSIVPAKGLPVVPQVSMVLAGIASIVAIALLFLPESREYFRAIAAQRRGAVPNAPAGAGVGARPSLRTLLFPPKRSPGGTTPSQQPRPSAADLRAEARVAKSKQRSDAEAVARGADLARSRAKASKSRRTS